MKPVYTEEAPDSLPPVKELQAESSFKDGDLRQVGRNYSNQCVQPWDEGPPKNFSIGDGDLTCSQQSQQNLT